MFRGLKRPPTRLVPVRDLAAGMVLLFSNRQQCALLSKTWSTAREAWCLALDDQTEVYMLPDFQMDVVV